MARKARGRAKLRWPTFNSVADDIYQPGPVQEAGAVAGIAAAIARYRTGRYAGGFRVQRLADGTFAVRNDVPYAIHREREDGTLQHAVSIVEDAGADLAGLEVLPDRGHIKGAELFPPLNR